MTHQPYEWISVSEASRRLNVSVSTIRRMIESGELVGEREPLGGSRERYRVRMPQETPHEASGGPQMIESPHAPPDASETTQDDSVVTTRLLDTVLTQAEQIAELRERVGRAESRAETLQAQVEQYCLDQLEATERAFRAEAEATAAERRAAELAERLAHAERPWWVRMWGARPR